MSYNNNARFGAVVTISVGPDQEGFDVHQNVLTAVVGAFSADLSKEQPKTFQAFMVWLYAAYTYATRFALPPDSDTIALLELYAFAYKFLIPSLEDAIVSVLYENFVRDSDLWFTLGSDKLALETFLRLVPPESHLYRLVVRSLAYSASLRSGYLLVEPGRELRYTARPSTLATESQVEEVMESLPSELLGPILKEALLLKTLGTWRQGFDNIVGHEMKFLRRFDDVVTTDSSAS
ncbi:hypothetical protein FJTKL_05134 [Diaporthe vaccinii]|uniref:BTB domain-containing protein n=1 Tax=Diaporthe vaccinii TaxID=105482 RepID=A0ABR4FEN6_9PEZI